MEDKKKSVSLADIPKGADGFPLAGQVVKHFRKRKKWTQQQLASKLGVTELMVRNIENKNLYLDSIERRRVLCKLLGIPPVLLGLASVDQLEQIFADKASAKVKPAILHTLESSDTETYKKLLVDYNQKNISLSGASLIGDIELIIPTVNEQVKTSSNKQQKQELLYVLWEFHRLAAKIHADFKNNLESTTRHLDSALVIALELRDANLIAITHAHVAGIRLLEQSPHLARPDIDAALQQMKHASPLVQCDVYGLAARIYHSSTLDLGDSINASRFLDRSGELLHNGIAQDGRYTPMGLDIVRARLTNIDSLLHMKRAHDALDSIEDTDNATPEGVKRRKSLLALNRASCFLLLDYPGQAMHELALSYSISKKLGEIQKLDRIRNMYQELKAGPYKNSRAVLDFEERLLKL